MSFFCDDKQIKCKLIKVTTMTINVVTKISKMDTRCLCIGKFIHERSYHINEGFYSDGQFRYKIFSHYQYNNDGTAKYVFFLVQIVPNTFIEYTFSVDNRMNYIRFWITEDKCEVP